MILFFAELDERKRVAAVWVKGPSDRTPKIFDRRKHAFDPRSQYDFIGAPQSQIEEWLLANEKRPN